MDLGAHVAGFRFVIRDRAGQLTDSFDAVLAGSSIQEPKILPQSPRVTSAERFALTARASGGTRLRATRRAEAQCRLEQRDRWQDLAAVRVPGPRRIELRSVITFGGWPDVPPRPAGSR
jgi:hypothetical protein